MTSAALDVRGATRRYSYDRVAWCYDEIASIYSLGAIAEAKSAQAASLEPGDRVLYAGVGRGDDALEAARRGARVTAVDISPRMLRRLAARLARSGLSADLHCGDVLEHRPLQAYDAVAANFFLNVFAGHALSEALAHLASLLRPGGRFLLADFARPADGRTRALASAYYWPVAAAAWGLGLCALHPIHDYPAELARAGLRVRERTPFRLFPGGPAFYESFVSERAGASG